MSAICCQCNLPKEPPKTNSGSAFRYICRLCLMRAEQTEPIFVHPGDSTLADKIFACTGVRIDEQVTVGPTAICMACKTTIYKSFQFLELCQRNNKIIQNLLVDHEKSARVTNESTGGELRLVIRTADLPTKRTKRINSRRKSARSNLEASTSQSDVSWSDNDDDDRSAREDEVEEVLPLRQVAYETDTQEDSPKRQKFSPQEENRVPSLVIPRARLNGGMYHHKSPLAERRPTSRASTAEPTIQEDSPQFQCEFCRESFPYVLQIQQHIGLYHADRKHELDCKFCSKSFYSTESLRKHCDDKHQACSLIECKLCQRYFTSRAGLHQHFRSIVHRAATGEAVFPRRRSSCMSYAKSPGRRNSVSSDYGGSMYGGGSHSRTPVRPINNNPFEDDDFNPYENICYDEVVTYKCDYCEQRFDDQQSLAKHTEVRPCRVELEQLDLDLLLEKVDLDELLQPLHSCSSLPDDVAIIEPPIEIVDLT